MQSGVGFAILLLSIITNSKKVTEKLPKNVEKGLNFWKAMFILAIIAMTSSQNVFGAISGGSFSSCCEDCRSCCGVFNATPF